MSDDKKLSDLPPIDLQAGDLLYVERAGEPEGAKATIDTIAGVLDGTFQARSPLLQQVSDLAPPQDDMFMFFPTPDTIGLKSFTNFAQSLVGAGGPATAQSILHLDSAGIKALYEAGADTNPFTDADKAKLVGLESSKFLGTYVTLSSLETAHPSPTPGSYAHVDSGTGNDAEVYIWDNDDAAYVPQAGNVAGETPASVLTKYESNPDRNGFTDAEKDKLGPNFSASARAAAAEWTDHTPTGSNYTIDLSTSDVHYLQSTEQNCAITVSDLPQDARKLLLEFRVPADGSWTFDLPSGLKWANDYAFHPLPGMPSRLLIDLKGNGDDGIVYTLDDRKPTRDQIVARLANYTPFDGEPFQDDQGLIWRGQINAVGISDMPGVVPDGADPLGMHFPEHHGIAFSGTAADNAKIDAWKVEAKARAANYNRLLSDVKGSGGVLNLHQVGAVQGSPQPAGLDVAPHLNQAMADVLGKKTGGKVIIPLGQWLMRSPAIPPRGTVSQNVFLEGEHPFGSVLDFRNMDTTTHGNDLITRPTGPDEDGPSYLNFANFRIRGDDAQTMNGINADFLSQSRLFNVAFHKLANAVITKESFAFAVLFCWFNEIKFDVMQFNSNFHNFRFIGNNGNECSQTPGGAVINAKSPDETHSPVFHFNNFDGVGTLLKTVAGATAARPDKGGITGLDWVGFYTEGYEAGMQFFDIDPDGILRGPNFRGGSFSKANKEGTPHDQVFDNMVGGYFGGVRVNGIPIKAGNNNRFMDWDRKTCNLIGETPLPLPTGRIAAIDHDAGPVGNSEFSLSAPFSTQSATGLRYKLAKSGIITCSGGMDHGSAVPNDTTVFTIPADMRPDINHYFNTTTRQGSTLYTADIQVSASGAVIVRSASGRFVGFDGVWWEV